jgi:hypothetical protein
MFHGSHLSRHRLRKRHRARDGTQPCWRAARKRVEADCHRPCASASISVRRSSYSIGRRWNALAGSESRGLFFCRSWCAGLQRFRAFHFACRYIERTDRARTSQSSAFEWALTETAPKIPPQKRAITIVAASVIRRIYSHSCRERGDS